MKILLPLLFAFTVCGMASCGENKGVPSTGKTGGTEKVTAAEWGARADSGSRALLRSFWDPEMYYFWTNNHGNKEFQYWPQAHALDVLVDAYERSNDDFYREYFDLWFSGVWQLNNSRHHKGWYNNFFDDMEWIALALLRTYKITGEEKYKEATLELWEYIKEGWNDHAGGGIAWERYDHIWSKNACSNGPASILASRLYREFDNEEDKEWALKIYEWEYRKLYHSTTGAVDDNINGNTGQITDWKFSYNQGTFVGAAVELYGITGEQRYLNNAIFAADYTLTELINKEKNILRKVGDGDGGLFNGIFIRYFTKLIQVEDLEEATRKRYLQFMQHNAETLWTKGKSKEHLFSPDWSQSPDPGYETGLTEHTSGCMLLEAMSVLQAVEELE
ncbi:MAG: AGE family epimerase/isomerase [Prevotellaceae bacterium]|jgi:predicted alpha-1,6-mannanase (GH76 family)|nr:AGE family epimerase/isomerase [Prevotellaceae bacterium]